MFSLDVSRFKIEKVKTLPTSEIEYSPATTK